MDHKALLRHLTRSVLKADGSGEFLNPITEDMFETTDIVEVLQEGDMIFVEFRGINGILPLRLFDENSKTKISNWIKARNSPLWKVLND